VNRKAGVLLARYGIPAAIAITLIASFRLYSFAYFWLDDFNNLYLTRREGFWNIVVDIINPASLFFRPLGMLTYWILYRFAELNALPYHLLSWTLHGVNTVLAFLFLRHIVRSQYAAGLAVLFFAFRANFSDIYWNFAHIFQLLTLGLVLTGLLLYARFGYSFKETLALTAVMILAIRAEEHGVLLPILWFGYELLVRRNLNWRALWLRYAIFAVVAAWFTYLKITTMQDTDPTHPYYLDLSALTFGHGYAWYFNSLYQTSLRTRSWFIISAVLALLFAVTRNTRGLFFLVFTYVTLLPYVFLINHRFDLYLYMPSVGIAGLLALGIHAIQRRLQLIHPRPMAVAFLSAVFSVAAVRHFRHEEHRGRVAREYYGGVFSEYRKFFIELASQPDADRLQTVYYTALPRHAEGPIVGATEFFLRRLGVQSKIVEKCPAEGACVTFENGHLRRIQ
jgi:hypothetical protein